MRSRSIIHCECVLSGTLYPSQRPSGIAVGELRACGQKNGASDPMQTTTDYKQESTALIVPALRPKQVLAATLLVQGQQGKQVAAMLNISEETVSRWRQQPAFQAMLHQLLQETIDATKLGMLSLTVKAINELHNLVGSFSDATSLKACALVLNRVGPVLGIIGTKLREETRG
jgi:predicted transcriptional regulator